MVFIGVGACKLFFNWTTGVVSVAPLSLQLPPFGFVRGSEYAPMLLFVTFPLGALVFLLRRPALVRVPKTLADPTASECRTVSEARE
jgi:hypothetical protein